MTAGDVAALTGGRLEGVSPEARISGPVVVDSRLCTAGSVFVCVVGEHTDGHLHVSDAYRRDAVLAIAERPVDGPMVLVDDTVKALGYLAGGVLRRTTNCRVIGVTGSSGKTSTKDLIAAIVAEAGATVAAEASLNNEIGLPLTVLGVDESTRYLVLEYSARGIGHIAYLCRIARPDIAVVLNVGTAHLGEFGSREAVAAAKGELVEALPSDGVAVLGVDDLLVAAMRSRTSATVVGFGVSAVADVRVEDLRLMANAQPRFRLTSAEDSADVRLQISGAHQALNAAAAAAAARAAGMTLAETARALGEVTSVSAHRMQVATREDGLLVVDDAYNANPESMRAALDALVALGGERPGATWAVLGEMRELGDDAGLLHESMGTHAAANGVDHVVVVGSSAARIAAGTRTVAAWTGTVDQVENVAAATALVSAGVGPSDVVLVKASNAIGLWRVADALLDSDLRGGATIEVTG